MGMKMSKARCNGTEITLKSYDNDVHHDLNCYYCSAKVCYVVKHKRTIGNREININSYFRLSSGSNHSEGCRYSIDGEIRDIYAKHADSEYLTKSQSKYIVRILFTDQSRTDENQTKNKNHDGTKSKQNLNYISTGKKTAYLSTIRRIIKLYTILENDKELQEKVTLTFNTKADVVEEILWKNFLFDLSKENETKRLYDYINTSFCRHPLCICGTILEINSINKKYCFVLAKDSICNNEKIVVEIYANEKSAHDFLNSVGRKIAFFLSPYTRNKQWSGKESKITFHNVVGNVFDERQILLLDEE